MDIKFEMLTLNEQNVNDLYEKCLLSESSRMVCPAQLYKNNTDHCVYFDDIKIMEYRRTIYYLTGQLLEVHQQNKEISIKSCIVKYNKKVWTKDMETLIHFLYLGIAGTQLRPIDDITKTITVSPNVTPTLSPSDPNFAQWLKADGIMWAELGQETSGN